jgi:hypothetical protein
VITRKGGWIIPRFVFGKPVEAFDSKNRDSLEVSFILIGALR